MSNFWYKYFKIISLIALIGLLTPIISYSIKPIFETLKDNPNYNFNQQALAQQSITNNNSLKQHIIVQASGHFANNQIKNGLVTWIQGGFWNLQINNKTNFNKSNNNTAKPNLTAAFNANFTMVKPDGSLSHTHWINNFNSTNVIFAGKDIIVTGIADIHSNAGLEFKQIPLTVHLMGKKVLGLTINVEKTNGHFASSNEMYGTLIDGFGLNNPNENNKIINNADNRTTTH